MDAHDSLIMNKVNEWKLKRMNEEVNYLQEDHWAINQLKLQRGLDD